LALSGLKALKRLRIESLSGFHETALDGTPLDEIELGNDALSDSSRILARLTPVRVICGGKVIELEEPKLTRFIVNGVGIILSTGALELAVIGDVQWLVPGSSIRERLRALDLLHANMTKLHLGVDLPFLHRLTIPAVLECVGRSGVRDYPRLEEVIVGNAPLRELEGHAFCRDFSLECLPLPRTLKKVDSFAFADTLISNFDAGVCESLESFGLGFALTFHELVLPDRFSGTLSTWTARTVEHATFGSIELTAPEDGYILVFGEVRFTSLAAPRGGFAREMFVDALVFGEKAQLLEREAAPARAP
jgi:hypothetical protein